VAIGQDGKMATGQEIWHTGLKTQAKAPMLISVIRTSTVILVCVFRPVTRKPKKLFFTHHVSRFTHHARDI
jgi:hypothetical protein